MKKILLTFIWLTFLTASIAMLIQVDRWYVYSKVPVSLPSASYYLDFWNDGFIYVDGTISQKNNDSKYDEFSKNYDDLNSIKIECNYSKKQCIHSTAVISNIKGYKPLLHVYTDEFNIVKWDKNTLIYEENSSCYKKVFTLFRETKNLTGIQKYSKTNNGCKRDDEITYSIINGFEHQWQKEREVQNTILNILIGILLFTFTGYKIYRVYKPLSAN